MALDKLVEELESSTTRRSVIQTGAKLAYAAPIVAASFKLTANAAGAVSANGPCTAFVCGNRTPCVDRETGYDCWCFEVAATPGQGLCLSDFGCGSVPACPNGQSDCPAGSTCVTNTCCGQGVQLCAPACPSSTDGFRAQADGPTASGH